MRSLWTAASGMTAQQLHIDTIANNLANVYTTGYKKDRLEFQTLLYQTMQRATLDEADNGRPVNLQVGLGVRPSATTKIFTQGNAETTNNPLDFLIEGDGFFVVDRSNDMLGVEETVYTRDGSFKLSITDDEATLVTSDGYRVLDSEGEPIVIPANIPTSQISVDASGLISYPDPDSEDGEFIYLDNPIGLVQFPNVQGLESVGGNFYKETLASGEPLAEIDGDLGSYSRIMQKCLEMSNVNVAEEMVDMIVAQRAFELNSKAIITSDDMLQIANNLKS